MRDHARSGNPVNRIQEQVDILLHQNTMSTLLLHYYCDFGMSSLHIDILFV